MKPKVEKAKGRTLIGIMPVPPGHRTLGGLTLVFKRTVLIDGYVSDEVETEFVTQDVVLGRFKGSGVDPATISHGFRVALHSSFAATAELIRVIELLGFEE